MDHITNANHWDIKPSEAIEIQKKLRSAIEIKPLDKEIKVIAGADVSFNKYSPTIYACIVVFEFPSLKELTRSLVVTETHFPYVPGLLSFREIPALLKAYQQLTLKPDVVVLDGQGIAHPRRMGIASHFGLVNNIATIGCAKSLLYGKYTEPEINFGSTSNLYDKDEIIGSVVRTKTKVKPVFISPGHLITLKESVEIIKKCVTKYRIPEPTRNAHLIVNELRIGNITPNQQCD